MYEAAAEFLIFLKEVKLKSECTVETTTLIMYRRLVRAALSAPAGRKPPEAARFAARFTGTARKELFGPPVRISDELKRIVDPEGVGNEMTRPDVNKNLWAYITANDLQHPDDRRTIRNDSGAQSSTARRCPCLR